jgi:hypothetical protein
MHGRITTISGIATSLTNGNVISEDNEIKITILDVITRNLFSSNTNNLCPNNAMDNTSIGKNTAE